MRLLLTVLFAASLLGCGAAHLRPQDSPALGLAASAYIGRVTVSSKEESAKANEALQAKMRVWETEARSSLQEGLAARGYQVVTEAPTPSGATLIWNLDIDVQYGNRALRYTVGFGAGKGHVRSTLVVDDGAKQEKYRSGADSDLAIGGFGGDIGAVLRDNIHKLVGALPAPNP